MKRQRIRFSLRLALFSIGLVVLSVAITSITLYERKKEQLKESLGNQLLAIVNSTAPLIDGDVEQFIYRDKNGKISDPEDFERLRQELVKVKKANHLSGHGSPIYTLRKAPDFAKTGDLEFVLMTDKDASGHWFVGNRYKARPQLLKALNGQSAVTDIYRDSEGMWISAAAPIRDSQGKVVAVLQADRHINFFYQKAREEAFAVFNSALISVCLAGILAFFFAHRLLKPLQQLLKATRRIGGGDLDVRLPLTRNDEFGDVFSGFNEMTSRLAQISENRDRQEKELLLTQKNLIAARDKAEAATRAKSLFLANMSHEIRTPMNAIIGLADLINSTELDATQQDYIRTMQASSETLLALVNDVLDFSKIESGKFDLDRIPFSPTDNINQALDLIRPSASAKGLQLRDMIDESLPTALAGDPARLRQIFVNLLSNAVKFTDKGRIGVTVRGEGLPGKRYRLSVNVMDTGIGIAPDRIDRLFKTFSQVDDSSTRRHGGTGLGLALSKKLVEMMDGSLSVESTPGKGSTFHFHVDLSFAELPHRQAEPSTPLPTPKTTLPAATPKDPGNSNQEKPSAPQKPTAKPSPVASKPKLGDEHPLTILIAEDNPVNQKVLGAILKRLGYAPAAVDNGRKAIEAAENGAFDLILMDIQMPELDGLKATEHIKKKFAPENRPQIIVVTANATDTDRAAALEAGADDFLTKPVRPDLLAKALKSCPQLGVTAKTGVECED